MLISCSVEQLQERVALLQEEVRETHENALVEQQQLGDIRRALDADRQRLKDAVQQWHTHAANRGRHKDALVRRMQKVRSDAFRSPQPAVAERWCSNAIDIRIW